MFDDWHRLTVVYDLIDCCWFKATSNYILLCLLFECRFNFKLQCRRAAGGAKKMLENKKIKDENRYTPKVEASTDNFTCWKCKSKKCTYYQIT